MRKSLFPHENSKAVEQGGWAVFIFGDFQSQTEQSTEQPGLTTDMIQL